MLARYTIIHELGRGTTCAVYEARDRTTGAVVALKRLDPALLTKDASLAERFLKHARSAQLLKHRNIVEIHDAAAAAGTAYVAMDMLEGESLRAILDKGPLPVARAIRIAHDIASGLAHAHLQGVVHGGLKPSNIIVVRSGVAKITDFGIGQLGQAAPLSPEQARGVPVDHRSDLFALGALLYEMLTHRPPAEGAPPPPSELNQHVPRALDAIVLSMLAAQPADRMPGVPVLLRALQGLEEGLGLASGTHAATDEPAAGVPPAGPEPKLPPDPDEFRITDHEDFDYRRAEMRRRETWPERSPGAGLGTWAAVTLVLAMLGIGVLAYFVPAEFTRLTGLKDYFADFRERNTVARRTTEAPPTAPAASPPTAPPPVAETAKDPVAAFGPWQASPPRPADDRQAEKKSPAVGTPRPIAPPPVAEAIKEPAPAPDRPQASPPPTAASGQTEQESSGTLFGLKPTPSNPLAADLGPLPQIKTPVARAPEQPAPAPAAAKERPRIKQPAAKIAEQHPRGTAQLILAVSPGGELYINGEHHGTTPPVTTFDLEPGMHRIEVRSGSRKPYVTYMTVEPGDVRRIRHDFNATPSRPPG